MNTHRINGRAADWLTAAFYAAVVGIAGVGCALAAVAWSSWELWAILPAVAVLELAALALLFRADHRRRLGERAVAYRVLAVGVGSLAIGINWFGHADSLIAAAFFAGFSALGLCMALLMSGDRRRDHLRDADQLPETLPAYGLWQWLRHPWLTRRAAALFRRNPDLKLFGSLKAAAEEKRSEERHAALKALLIDMVGKKYRDPLVAQVIITTVDMDEITRRFAAAADLDAFVTELWARVPIGATAETAAPKLAPVPSISAARPAVTGHVVPVESSRIPTIPARNVAEVARAIKAANPALTNRTIAEWLGKGESTIRGYLKEPTGELPTVTPGADRPSGQYI